MILLINTSETIYELLEIQKDEKYNKFSGKQILIFKEMSIENIINDNFTNIIINKGKIIILIKKKFILFLNIQELNKIKSKSLT